MFFHNELKAFNSLWKNNWEGKRFYHISTDEVYGSLGESGLFKETTSFNPNSPYAASKAGSDHFVRAYGETYDMPYVISNCSNNYGPYQFPEIDRVRNYLNNSKSHKAYHKFLHKLLQNDLNQP